ncbi:MAG: sulfite reductase subunit A, partial [Candidatus Zixiibacteriota bacterium]
MSLKSDGIPRVILERDDFQALFDSLSSHGYRIIGPTIRGDGIVYDDICGVDDLPIGWIDRQKNGRYRLARHKKKMLFAYVVPQDSWKRFLYPVEETIWAAERTGKKVNVHPREEDDIRQAF